MNDTIKIIDFLARENFVSESYMKVILDMVMLQALHDLETKLGCKINREAFEREIRKEALNYVGK